MTTPRKPRKRRVTPSVRSDCPASPAPEPNSELLTLAEQNFEQALIFASEIKPLSAFYNGANTGAVRVMHESGPSVMAHHHGILYATLVRVAREVLRLDRELKAVKATIGL